MNEDEGDTPRLHCPICKVPSEKFIPIYLNFDKSKNSTSSYNDDTTAAITTLSSENIRLTEKLKTLKSITKGKLAEYEEMEETVKRLNEDKQELEDDVKDLEMENNALISEWNELEIKNNLLKTEKLELKSRLQDTLKENVELCHTWSKMALRLGKVKEKRHEIKSVYKREVVKQQQQALELNVVKSQMAKSTAERKNLSLMLELSQEEITKMKRAVKRLKKFYCRSSTIDSKSRRFSSFMSKMQKVYNL